MNIGSLIRFGADKDAIIEARESIIAILKTGAPEAALVAGVTALKDLCAVSHVTIQNCNLTNAARKIIKQPKKKR